MLDVGECFASEAPASESLIITPEPVQPQLATAHRVRPDKNQMICLVRFSATRRLQRFDANGYNHQYKNSFIGSDQEDPFIGPIKPEPAYLIKKKAI